MIFILSLITSWYDALAVILVLTLFISIIDKLGKSIVLLDTVAIFGCFICVLMPVIGYNVYNQDFPVVRLFRMYMQVPKDVYFSFALPAMSAFTTAVCWPIKLKGEASEITYLTERFKEISCLLSGRRHTGIQILATGIIMLYASSLLPASLRFIAALFYFASFAGLLYMYFGPAIAYKRTILVVVIVFTFVNALQTGMFTIMIYMGITLASFFFIGSKMSFLKKIALFAAAVFFIFLLQSVKESFRKSTWKDNYQGNKVALFQRLVSNQLDRDDIWSPKALFPIYVRANQGLNVSKVMVRIPSSQPFDNGEYLLKSAAASLVPRLLWPDKPEAGGAYNMLHYTGIRLRGWSTNIGPLGEAYGNFGVTGGIIYMLFLGVLIRLVYKKVFQVAARIPLILLWIPVMFYQVTYSAESDSLQIFNSLIKSAFFVWMLYKIFPGVFGAAKQSMKTLRARSISKPAASAK